MALSFTPVEVAFLAQTGQYSLTMYDITLDTDYPTGGWPILPKSVGLGGAIFGAHVVGHRGASDAAATTGYLFLWDFVDGTLQSFDTGSAGSAPLAETSAGDNDLDGRKVRVVFWGV